MDTMQAQLQTKMQVEKVTDKKLKGQLVDKERLYNDAVVTAAKVEQWLLPSEGGFLEAEGLEQTRRFSQEAILKEVDVASSRKAFNLELPDLGPYSVDYVASGRYLLLGGRKGHLAVMDWKQAQLITEMQVMETVRDVKFLHNELFFAVAQKKYTFIYNKQGIEVHRLKDHISTLKLEFLPHHFLLVSTDKAGILRYQDTSTGHMVGQFRTHLGRCGVLRMNPYNAVVGLGHNNGTVTMWSPNMVTPLVTLLCHRGPLTAIAFELEGRQMVTAGIDGKVKVWDVRKLTPLHSCSAPTAAKSLDISQRGLLAVGYGSGIEIWRNALASKQAVPYMSHRVPRGAQVQDLAFCPYEDVLAVGHASGISSLLIPGAGEPNYDTYVANPYQKLKQRREAEVHSLLDKLQPEMIVLNPDQVGSVQRSVKEHNQIKEKLSKDANNSALLARGKPLKVKRKSKGRDKPSKRHKKKQENVITARSILLGERKPSRAVVESKSRDVQDVSLPSALARFSRK